MKAARRLAIVLFTLSATYASWFRDDRHVIAALLVFALPPLVLGMLAWRRWPRAGLSAGLLALAWFSHGIMVAWTRAPERGYALTGVVLSLLVIGIASVPGLRARFGKRT